VHLFKFIYLYSILMQLYAPTAMLMHVNLVQSVELVKLYHHA